MQVTKMKDLLAKWDDEEDGDSTACMTGGELDFLIGANRERPSPHLTAACDAHSHSSPRTSGDVCVCVTTTDRVGSGEELKGPLEELFDAARAPWR